MFMPIISGTNQTPNVQLVSVVCMQGNLDKTTYPPNLNITLIISKMVLWPLDSTWIILDEVL